MKNKIISILLFCILILILEILKIRIAFEIDLKKFQAYFLLFSFLLYSIYFNYRLIKEWLK
jgi:hypothetical protein